MKPVHAKLLVGLKTLVQKFRLHSFTLSPCPNKNRKIRPAYCEWLDVNKICKYMAWEVEWGLIT